MNELKEKLEKRNILLLDMVRTDWDTAIVLCKWNDEFVIWTCDTNTGDTFWGHYFKDLDDAVEYFVDKTTPYDNE